MPRSLSAPQKRALARDGYVVLPGVVPRARVDAALREINHDLALAPADTEAGDSETDYRSYHSSAAAVVGLYAATGLRPLVESLLAPGPVEAIERAQVALRLPAAPGSDAARYKIHVDGLSERGRAPSRFTLCAGVLLSDVPKPLMGNLLVYPGTHVRLAEAIRARGMAALDDGGLRSLLGELEPVPVTGRAGDVVLLHHQTAHDKALNRSPRIRYMAYFRVYHSDCWRDRGPAAVERGLADLWAEWPAMRKVHAAA